MITTRWAELSDYPRLAEYDEFMGDRRLDLQEGAILAADDGRSLAVGYLLLRPSQFLGWPLISALCVQPSHRRRGVARSLVHALCQDPRYVRIYTTTEQENGGMRALLTTINAREIGYVDALNFSEEREILYRLK